EMVKDAPSMHALAGKIAEIAKDAVPCAYNAIYDRTILHRYLTSYDIPALDPRQLWICPLTIVRDVDKWERGSGRHKLVSACRRHGVELTEAHSARAD